jgi:hypothetical protein
MAFARGAQHRIFSKKNRKTVFAGGLCQGLSAQDFFKIRQGLSALNFQKKNKTPLFADGPASMPSAKKISKTVNLTPGNGYFFGRRPTVGSQHNLCREPVARVLGKESWLRKISRRPFAECYSRQRRCRVFDALCREFQALGKAWISSSDGVCHLCLDAESSCTRGALYI